MVPPRFDKVSKYGLNPRSSRTSFLNKGNASISKFTGFRKGDAHGDIPFTGQTHRSSAVLATAKRGRKGARGCHNVLTVHGERPRI